VTGALCVTDVVLDDETVGLRAVGDVIVALGPEVVAEPGDTELAGHGQALIPGLVNGHGHAAMTLLRGQGDDLPLMPWLETCIWPAEARLTRDDVYWGTRLACLEMIRAGTTHFWDMYWFQFEVAQAVVDSGMRATVSQVFLSFDGAPDEARPEAASDGLDRLGGFGSLVTPSLGPHAIYTVDEPTLRFVAELAAERDVPVQIHLSETEDEVHDCLAAHGCRPAVQLDRLGLLTDRTVLAHGVWLDAAELELVAARGATVVTNPVSNMKLAVGRAFPYPAARAAGIPIGLGTDGAASNNSLDLLTEVKMLALLQKHTAADAAVLPASEAWTIVTGAAAPRLGGTPLAVGAPADFALVDARTPELSPAPLVDGLVYSGSGAAVQTVVVAGTVVMRDRHVDGEDEIRDRAAAAATRVRGGDPRTPRDRTPRDRKENP
jgi:5-methylthioadenosine/S-adenosylhomocysteine deaminase